MLTRHLQSAGVTYKNKVKADFEADPRVASVVDVGVKDTSDGTSYPTPAVEAARLVQRGEADRALLICGTGLGTLPKRIVFRKREAC